MGRSMTKSQVLDELASLTGVERQKVSDVMTALATLVYREAANGFTIPGLCKFEVVDRKPRRCRDPRTGVALMIGARKAVRVKAAKRARDTIAPPADSVVTVLDSLPAAPVVAPAAAPDEPPGVADAAPVSGDMPAGDGADGGIGHTDMPPIVFACLHCGREIEAPGGTTGAEAECPACGGVLTVPDAGAGPAAGAEPAAVDATPAGETSEDESSGDAQAFIYFRCGACGQEIEAPQGLIGTQAVCPACGTTIQVPLAAPLSLPDSAPAPAEATDEDEETSALLIEALKRRTIRIELPDEAELASRPRKIVFKRR